MFHSRNMEHCINWIHDRVLQLVYSETPNFRVDIYMYYSFLPEKIRGCLSKKPSTICQWNEFASELISAIFQFVQKSYKLRNTNTLRRKRVNLACNSTDYLQEETSQTVFKNKIKTWATNQCLCRLCKEYLGMVGLIGLAQSKF